MTEPEAKEEQPEPAEQPQLEAAGFRAYMKDGWDLGGEALEMVRGRPGLRRYFLIAAIVVLGFEAAVAEALILVRHDGDIPERLTVTLLTTYFVTVLTTAAAVGLAGLSDRILNDEEPEAKLGFRLAWSRLPQVALWSVFAVLLGIPARLITAYGVDQIATILLGFSLAVVVFFAIPAMALEGDWPLRAARRSVRMVRRFWAGQAAGMVYVWLRPAIFIGLPGAVALITGYILDKNGRDLLGWSLMAGGAVALAIAYFLFVCARSVLSVALFHIGETGRVPKEMDAARLTRLMRGPTSWVRRATQRFDGERLRRLRDWVHNDDIPDKEPGS